MVEGTGWTLHLIQIPPSTWPSTPPSTPLHHLVYHDSTSIADMVHRDGESALGHSVYTVCTTWQLPVAGRQVPECYS